MNQQARSRAVMVFVGDENAEVLAFFARHEGFTAHWLPADDRLVDSLSTVRPDVIFLDVDALEDEAVHIASRIRADASIADAHVLAISYPPRPECEGVEDWCAKPLTREALESVASRINLP